MIDVKVDKADPTDLYEQVAGELRRAIAEGEAKPGERLPPARDLAAVLGVNTNTVLRSLRLLRDEGLLEFRRGRGISVAGTPERGAVVQRARELVEFARQQGYRLDELVEIIETSAKSRGDPSTGVADSRVGVERPAPIKALRPTFASNALGAGVTVFERARLMGTSARMIERHYGTLIEGAQAGLVNRLDVFEAEIADAAEKAQAAE